MIAPRRFVKCICFSSFCHDPCSLALLCVLCQSFTTLVLGSLLSYFLPRASIFLHPSPCSTHYLPLAPSSQTQADLLFILLPSLVFLAPCIFAFCFLFLVPCFFSFLLALCILPYFTLLRAPCPFLHILRTHASMLLIPCSLPLALVLCLILVGLYPVLLVSC